MWSRSCLLRLVVALTGALGAFAWAVPPPFQGAEVPGTILITARDYAHEPSRAIVDRWPGEPWEDASACRIGDAIVMKVLIHNWSEPAEWRVRGVGEFRQELPGQFNQPPPPPIAHPLVADPVSHVMGPYETRWFYLVIDGVPDVVFRGELDLDVTYIGPSGPQTVRVPGYVYRVARDPVAPMDAPWTEVLDDACRFASGATNEDQVFDLCTFYLYHSFKFAYDGDKPHWFKVIEGDNAKAWFALREMIDIDRSNGSEHLAADCQDVSGYLRLSINALGFDVGLMRLSESSSAGYGFTTNPICSIGRESSDPANYHAVDWALHQVAWRSGFSLVNVYDACLALKWTPACGPYWNPPRDWSLPVYWQTPNPGVPGRPEPFFGLVDRLPGSNTSEPVPLAADEVFLTEVF